MKKISTSWGGVARWYQETLENPESYQKKVIAPNLTRVLGLKSGMHVLDIACGEGWFARHCHALGATVTGIDIAAELIERARKISSKEILIHPGSPKSPKTVSFHRPLQWYWKTLAKAGFSVGRLEEWISHKVSQKGPRAVAEDRARKEIPLFLFMEARLQGTVV